MFARENKSIFFVLAFTLFLFSNEGSAQSFINGSFETNSVSVDQINMTNAAFNAAMSNTYAFGSYGDMDIITSSTWGPPQSGSWYVALTGGGTDIITMKLSSPLVTGNSYTISFYDRGNATFPTYPVRLGLSTANSAVGTTIYTGPVPSYGVWSQRSFTFIAPNGGQYISVQMTAGSLGDWVNIDNFRFVTTLPVNLLSFTGENKNNVNHLTWSTATELNNDYFTIERSNNGYDFNSIGTVDGHGNSSEILHYDFDDLMPFEGTNYYRLKQTDYDGKFSYSQTIAIKAVTENSLHWLLSENKNSITFNLSKADNGVITITDINGRIIHHGEFSNQRAITLDCHDFTAGLYIIHISSLCADDTFKLFLN